MSSALLAALRTRAEAAARELYDEVGSPRGLVCTTVAKVLDRLVAKRMVRRRREGRVNACQTTLQHGQTQRAMARDLLEQLAGGGPRPAIAAFVGARGTR